MKRTMQILALIVVSALFACSSEDAYKRGINAYENGEWKKAIRYFELVSTWDELSTDAQRRIYKAYFNWGKEQFSQRKWDDAIVHLGKVRREDEDYAAARELIGDTNYYKGKEAFDHGAWKKAIWFLNIVRSSNSHYQESRVLVRAAKAKLEQVVPDTLPLAVS